MLAVCGLMHSLYLRNANVCYIPAGAGAAPAHPGAGSAVDASHDGAGTIAGFLQKRMHAI